MTPDAGWFALWEGHPGLPTRWDALARLQLPERAYLLFRASVAKVVELAVETEYLGHSHEAHGHDYAEAGRAAGRVRSPNLWWPDARSWVVGTDIDGCLLYTSPSPRDRTRSRMPSSA